MFLHMLSDEDRSRFLDIAYLFCIGDAPMFWDGKSEDEITGETDLSDVSIQVQRAKSEAYAELARECGVGDRGDGHWRSPVTFALDFTVEAVEDRRHIGESLVDSLRPLPITKQNTPKERQRAAVAALQEIASEAEGSLTATKILLFELMALCQTGDTPSEVETALFQEFVVLRGVEDFIVEDLLERARCMSREAVKTLSLILE